MKYTLILLFVLDVVLAGAAAIRMAGAPFVEKKPPAAMAPAAGYEREVPAAKPGVTGASATPVATPAGDKFTRDPQLADPNAALDQQAAGVKEAEDKVKLGRKIANGGKLP